ncbi:MAG: protoheme IX farnesyltransferase [Chloroflexi bacterium]|nr:protoheme IX farnesyltransferase [Chloroflexota bacterium]
MQTLKAVAPLFKLRTVGLLVVVALVSALAAARGQTLDWTPLLVLVAAGALACAGSGALNHYIDRDIDAVQSRTRQRPLPAGLVPPWVAGVMGAAMIVAAIGVSWQLNWLVRVFIALGALTYVVVYTCWLKRRTDQNIVIGGLAGSWASLAGWFTTTQEFGPVPVLLALIVFLWTPVHFWSFSLAHIADYRRSALPMLPVTAGERKAARYVFVYALLSLASSAALVIWSPFGTIYAVAWLLLAAMFFVFNFRLLKMASAERAWTNFKLSGVYLLGLFAAIGVAASLT